MQLNRFLAAAVPCLGAWVALVPTSVEASLFAVGYQREHWGAVDLEKNPALGFLFSLIAGMAQTEANEVEARNEAIPKGSGAYRWGEDKYNRCYVGNWIQYGARLDIGNIFFRLLAGGKP